jgi:hypothetical protein
LPPVSSDIRKNGSGRMLSHAGHSQLSGRELSAFGVKRPVVRQLAECRVSRVSHGSVPRGITGVLAGALRQSTERSAHCGGCVSLPKFRVITRECPVRQCQLMIICPYPFWDASWKSRLGRSVVLEQRRSREVVVRGRRGVPMLSGSSVRCPLRVRATWKAARCERSA